jgi:hypothetical protein
LAEFSNLEPQFESYKQKHKFVGRRIFIRIVTKTRHTPYVVAKGKRAPQGPRPHNQTKVGGQLFLSRAETSEQLPTPGSFPRSAVARQVDESRHIQRRRLPALIYPPSSPSLFSMICPVHTTPAPPRFATAIVSQIRHDFTLSRVTSMRTPWHSMRMRRRLVLCPPLVLMQRMPM